MSNYVFVIDTDRNLCDPIYPTQAQLLLNQKKAAVFCRCPFTITLKGTSRVELIPLTIKIDPSSKTTGLTINPSMSLDYCNLGDLLAKQLHWQEAEQAYKKGIQLLNNPSAFIYRKLAKTLAQQQRWIDALSAYKKAWDCQNQTHQTLKACQAQIEQGCETWETYFLLFQTLAEVNQWVGAIAAWGQAIKLAPYKAWWPYERCLKLSKKYRIIDELETLFRQHLIKNPGELDLGLNLSAVLEQQGRMGEVCSTHQNITNHKLKQRCPKLSPQTPLKLPQVNFTIIGAQKSGTSSLYYYLEEHPNISVSIKKRTSFLVASL